MRSILVLSLKLLVITLVAGLALGATYAITEEPIRQQNILKAEAARKSIFGEADFEQATEVEAIRATDERFAGVTDAYYAVQSGQITGCVVSIAASGYGGDITLTVGVDPEGRIAGLEVGSHSETPGLGAKARDAAFKEQFAGRRAPLAVVKSDQPSENEISAITGATITSQGVTDATNLAAEFAARLFAAGGK
ncbi:MAG: RnfABCDGE type electron transport complex subunit G [Clostridiales bacterium]|nr:RnfABCDGE type electron transport complex subunit G [Clostridiales bacterium]